MRDEVWGDGLLLAHPGEPGLQCTEAILKRRGQGVIGAFGSRVILVRGENDDNALLEESARARDQKGYVVIMPRGKQEGCERNVATLFH